MAEETPKTPETPPAQPAPEVQPAPAAELTIGGVPESKPPEPKTVTAPPLAEGVHYIWGTGRRKKAVARVRIRPGTGQITVNKRKWQEFFTDLRNQNTVVTPLVKTGLMTAYDIFVNVTGGGPTGQAGAISLGLSRALAKAYPDCDQALRDNSLMTRDARMKERKKYGQKGARKRFQFSKR